MPEYVLFVKVRCRMGHCTSLRRLVSGAREAAATLAALALSQVSADVVRTLALNVVKFSCGQLLEQLLSVTGPCCQLLALRC